MTDKSSGCQCPYCEEPPCENLPKDIIVKKCDVEPKVCATCGSTITTDTGVCNTCSSQ